MIRILKYAIKDVEFVLLYNKILRYPYLCFNINEESLEY